MHAATLDAAFYNRVNVAVSNQGNTSASLANLFHNGIMTFAVQQYNIQISNLAVHSLSNTLQVHSHGSINIDAALSTRAYSDFIHIHIGSMQQAATGSNSNNSNRTGLALSYQIGAFNGVNSNIHCRSACANLFANIKHRCFVHFAFANYNGTVNIYSIKGSAHSVNS